MPWWPFQTTLLPFVSCWGQGLVKHGSFTQCHPDHDLLRQKQQVLVHRVQCSPISPGGAGAVPKVQVWTSTSAFLPLSLPEVPNKVQTPTSTPSAHHDLPSVSVPSSSGSLPSFLSPPWKAISDPQIDITWLLHETDLLSLCSPHWHQMCDLSASAFGVLECGCVPDPSNITFMMLYPFSMLYLMPDGPFFPPKKS